MSALQDYMASLEELREMDRYGKTEGEDALLDRMDLLWEALTEQEKEAVCGLSSTNAGADFDSVFDE